MDPQKKKILIRITADVVCIACIGFPVLILFVTVKPYERVFYCDDESLMHPYKSNTIPTWVAGFVGILLPSLSILIIEGLQTQKAKASLRKYIKTCYQLLMPFFFGAGVTQLTTDIAKYSIGRLRPHFLTVCQPDVASCTSTTGYLDGNVCTGMNLDAIEEARLSFPSGHSSLSFYCMVWLMIYLQYRFTWKRYWLVRSVLQAIAFYLAYYTGLSRISDYMHHWSDVLSGALLGTVISILDALIISTLRKRTSSESIDCDSRLPLYERRVSDGKPRSDSDERILQEKNH